MRLQIEDMEPRALVDELLKFLRTSPLGEFRLRLQLRLCQLELKSNLIQKEL